MSSPDVLITNEGTIFCYVPLTDVAQRWIEENVEHDAMMLGNTLVVDQHYARDLAAGMIAAGLKVR